MTRHTQTRAAHSRQAAIPAAGVERAWPGWVGAVALAGVASVVAASAIVAKELSARSPSGPAALAAVAGVAGVAGVAAEGADLPSTMAPVSDDPTAAAALEPALTDPTPAAPTEQTSAAREVRWHYDLPPGAEGDSGIRWFNGRPVRPARTLSMLVTAYSPDARSCGDSADGITASLHSVETNGHALVAADRRVLPMGSMLTIPGYDQGQIVPVLDVGGKIKGNRLDVLFPTHEQARAWGVRRLNVVVWEYADGRPAGDWRRIRDGR